MAHKWKDRAPNKIFIDLIESSSRFQLRTDTRTNDLFIFTMQGFQPRKYIPNRPWKFTFGRTWSKMFSSKSVSIAKVEQQRRFLVKSIIKFSMRTIDNPCFTL